MNRRQSVIWSGPLLRAEFPYLTQMYNLLWHVVISVKRSGVDVKRCAVVSAIHIHLQKFLVQCKGFAGNLTLNPDF